MYKHGLLNSQYLFQTWSHNAWCVGGRTGHLVNKNGNPMNM